jgi:hypothetical protein
MSDAPRKVWMMRRFARAAPLCASGPIPFEQAMAYARACSEMMASPQTITLLTLAASDGAQLDEVVARWQAELLEHYGLEPAFAAPRLRPGADYDAFAFAGPGPSDASGLADAERNRADLAHALAELRTGTASLLGGAAQQRPWRCRRFAPRRLLAAASPVGAELLLAYGRLSVSFFANQSTLEALVAAARAGEDAASVLGKWKCEMLEHCGIERTHGLAALAAAIAARAVGGDDDGAPHGALAASAAAERASLLFANLPDVARASALPRSRRFVPRADGALLRMSGGLAPAELLQLVGALEMILLPTAGARAGAGAAAHGGGGRAAGSALADEARHSARSEAQVLLLWQRELLEQLGIDQDAGVRALGAAAVAHAAATAAAPPPAAAAGADAPRAEPIGRLLRLWTELSAAHTAGGAPTLRPGRAPAPRAPPLAPHASSPAAAAGGAPPAPPRAPPTSAFAAGQVRSTRVAVPPLALRGSATARSAPPRAPGAAAEARALPHASLVVADASAADASIGAFDFIVKVDKPARLVRPGTARMRVRPGWQPAGESPRSAYAASSAGTPRSTTARAPLPTARSIVLAPHTLVAAATAGTV